MKSIIPFIALLLSACSSYPTPMPNGRGGVANLNQVGGKGMVTYNADGSMGFTFDNEISFQHAAQAATTVGLSYIGYLQALAEQVTARFAAGQITLQQKNAALASIEQAKIAAKAGAYTEALGAGAEASVGTVVPP